MSNLVIPRREILTQQPTKPSGINLANPLARGVSVWLATSPHVFYGNRNLVAVSESGYNSSPVGKEGFARKWNRDAAAGVDFGTQQIFTGQAVTVMVIAAPTSTADMKAAFSQRAASGAYPQVDFIFNGSNDGLSASAGTVELVTYDGGSRGVTATSQLDGNVHCWVASNSTTLGYIIKDGVTQSLSQDTRVASAIYASNQKLCIGRMGDDAGSTIYQHDDPLYMVAVWPWQLSIAEAKLVSANPLQLIASRETRLFVPVSAGGATTVSSDAVATYKLLGSVQSSAPATYGIQGTLVASASANYTVRGPAQQSASATYVIKGAVQQSVAAVYAIKAAVQSEAAAGYAIHAAVTKDAVSAYLVYGAVQSDSAASYALRAAVIKEIAASYSILSATSVSASASAGYSIQGSTTNDGSANYGIRGSVDQTATASYGLRGSITSDTSATYSILSATSVSSSATAGYAIKGEVQSSIVAGYSIAQAVQAEIAASYIIRSGAVREAQAAYLIRGAVQKSIAASYAIEGQVFTGSISDADIARIVAAVLVALQATTTPVNVVAVNGDPVTVWPTVNQNAAAVVAAINASPDTLTVPKFIGLS